MTPEEVLRQLEKHEESCDKRYADIQEKLKTLDNRLWGIMGLIVLAAGLEHLL
jgi:chaperonin cofactor prefoldin